MVKSSTGPASPSDSRSGSPKRSGFQILDADFVRDAFGFSNRGVISDRRNNTKGIQIATNVDLSQWSEEELIQLDMHEELIEKLAPYLGKRGLEAAQALKENPLEVTWYDADLLSKAVMKYWAKYYGNIYDESVKSIKGRRLLTWAELDIRVRTVIYAVLQQVPSVSTVPNFWNHVTRQHWKHVHAELKVLDKHDLLRKGGEAEYFNEFLKQENLLNEKNGSNKMVTLQLPDINSGLSRSMDNINTTGLGQDTGAPNFAIKNELLLSSSFDSAQPRSRIGSPIPPMGSVNLRRGRSPSMNEKLLIDNYVKHTSDNEDANLSTANLRSSLDRKEQPSYPNKKLDHLGRKQRSSSINVGSTEPIGIKVPPPGYSDVTVVDDITVMHKDHNQQQQQSKHQRLQQQHRSMSKASSGAFTNSSTTPVSGSPNPSRRGSFNLDSLASPMSQRKQNITASRTSMQSGHNQDRRLSMNNLLPPLDSSLAHLSRSNASLRSLDTSPVTHNRKKLISPRRSHDHDVKLYVPSFGR